MLRAAAAHDTLGTTRAALRVGRVHPRLPAAQPVARSPARLLLRDCAQPGAADELCAGVLAFGAGDNARPAHSRLAAGGAARSRGLCVGTTGLRCARLRVRPARQLRVLVAGRVCDEAAGCDAPAAGGARRGGGEGARCRLGRPLRRPARHRPRAAPAGGDALRGNQMLCSARALEGRRAGVYPQVSWRARREPRVLPPSPPIASAEPASTPRHQTSARQSDLLPKAPTPSVHTSPGQLPPTPLLLPTPPVP